LISMSCSRLIASRTRPILHSLYAAEARVKFPAWQ
jgi:hypothetical protein